jgi:hypothetical protein
VRVRVSSSREPAGPACGFEQPAAATSGSNCGVAFREDARRAAGATDDLWGAKIRCPPEKSAICRQDANFGTPHALASATQKASPPARQAVSSSTTMRKRSLIPQWP